MQEDARTTTPVARQNRMLRDMAFFGPAMKCPGILTASTESHRFPFNGRKSARSAHPVGSRDGEEQAPVAGRSVYGLDFWHRVEDGARDVPRVRLIGLKDASH
jgi:hypothetical protein